ncbi:hypothetical protein AYM39_16050 [Methylomonas sp. DH-1]|nr:hypothetical protein AYM39_16050 [Methylomonas sp. DH-1]
MAGALRTYTGEQIDIDWKSLTSRLVDFDFSSALGGADDLGRLQLNGPWIVYQGQRLYAAPLYLMHKETDIQRLQVGKPVRCDLGRVRLPELPAGLSGYKTVEQRWLTAAGMAKCLNGQAPASAEIINPAQLFSHEARLGIARDNKQRKVQDGKLYQTRHLRILPEVQIELDAKGLDAALFPHLKATKLIRLGGEGRMASIEPVTTHEVLPFAKPKTVETLLIHFLTPADFDGQPYPAGFSKTERNSQTVWQGQLNGIELSIESAVIGKVHREGGWDMKNHQPRPVKSYIPAGSAWYCRLSQATDWQILSDKLHGLCVGNDTAWGRGHIVLGHWQDSSNI